MGKENWPLFQKAVTAESYLGAIVTVTVAIKPWSLRRDGCMPETETQDEKLPGILVKGLIKTCIKLSASKIESISVWIRLPCATALVGKKWHSSLNFTGA